MARSRFSRPPRPRIIGKKFVIVCEGKTEYNYFRAIRVSLRLSTLQINIANPEASDPRSIVNEAIQIRSVNKREGGWTDDDSAWAVFDGDEHIQNDPGNWNDALQLADSNGINLAVSNPSFELWFLLHFQDQQANIHRDQVIRDLKKHLPKYDKASDSYPMLVPRMAEATIRAIALEDRIHRDGLDRYANPFTGIYDLVEKLAAINTK